MVNGKVFKKSGAYIARFPPKKRESMWLGSTLTALPSNPLRVNVSPVRGSRIYVKILRNRIRWLIPSVVEPGALRESISVNP